MTARHSLGLWGYNNRYPSWRERAGSPFPDVEDPLRSDPYVYEWSGASDSFSVAYPAGIVAVHAGGAMGLGSSGTVDERVQAGLTKVAVPAVLPVGYTFEPYQELSASYMFDGLGAAVRPWDINRRRTAAGFVSNLWIPASVSRLLGVTSSLGGVSGVINSQYDIPTPGNRKVQIRVSLESTFVGTMSVKLSHNADGTTSPNPGGVTDYTGSFAPGAFTLVGSNYVTAWIDVGAIHATTLGTPTQFLGQLDLSGVSSFGPGYIDSEISFRLSPRCDVPFPSTITGIGSLFAPGGYVP